MAKKQAFKNSDAAYAKAFNAGDAAQVAAIHAQRARHTVATPGFVDCHLHSSFHLSRGLADEANAQSFLFDRMYPYEAAMEQEVV